MILQIADYEVDVLPEGQSINTSVVSSYDILICDMTGPQQDQDHMLNFVDTISIDLPIVIISEFGHESGLGKLVENPDIGILQKPFKSKELLSLVENLQHNAHGCTAEVLEKIA